MPWPKVWERTGACEAADALHFLMAVWSMIATLWKQALGDLAKLTLEKCDASELARLNLLVAQRTGQIALARARALVPRAVA